MTTATKLPLFWRIADGLTPRGASRAVYIGVMQRWWFVGFIIIYIFTLRVRLIRRPLRTGKILGVTVMSYLGQPEMTRLP